ncbi:MAG: transposase, partial [Candidatus Competibacter sp.]
AEVFLAWTHRVLLPQLPPATMIVLDNAAFHKRQDIQNTLRQAGHTRGYLPPYSPDLNPIEHQWAQAKALCKQSHCSVDELFRSNQI